MRPIGWCHDIGCEGSLGSILRTFAGYPTAVCGSRPARDPRAGGAPDGVASHVAHQVAARSHRSVARADVGQRPLHLARNSGGQPPCVQAARRTRTPRAPAECANFPRSAAPRRPKAIPELRTGESWDGVAQGPTSSALRPFSCRSRSRGRVISANASSTFLSSDLFLSAPRRGRLRQPRAALVRRLSVVAPSERQMAPSACERHTQAAHPCRDPTTRMVAVRDFDATTALLHGWLHRGGV